MEEERSSDEVTRDSLTGLASNRGFVNSEKDHRGYMLARVTDVDVAAKYCKKTAVAVQAGGFIGLWPLRLAKFFSIVHTFEPLKENYDCLAENVRHVPGIVPHYALLGAREGDNVKFKPHKMWGSRVVPPSEDGDLRVLTTIDALNLPVCDLIYLDIEGYELQALEGARKTIEKYRPVVTLEVWDANMEEYGKFMHALGYNFAKRTHADSIYVPA